MGRPEFSNYLIAHRDMMGSLSQSRYGLSIDQVDLITQTSVAIEAAIKILPAVVEGIRSSIVENSGQELYTITPTFRLDDDRRVVFTNGAFAGQRLTDLDRRTHDLRRDRYNPADEAVDLLLEKAIQSGATISAVIFPRKGKENRDVIIYRYDKEKNHGTISVINTAPDGNSRSFDEIKQIARDRFNDLNEVKPSDSVVVFTDAEISLEVAKQIVIGVDPHLLNSTQLTANLFEVDIPQPNPIQPFPMLKTIITIQSEPPFHSILLQNQVAGAEVKTTEVSTGQIVSSAENNQVWMVSKNIDEENVREDNENDYQSQIAEIDKVNIETENESTSGVNTMDEPFGIHELIHEYKEAVGVVSVWQKDEKDQKDAGNDKVVHAEVWENDSEIIRVQGEHEVKLNQIVQNAFFVRALVSLPLKKEERQERNVMVERMTVEKIKKEKPARKVKVKNKVPETARPIDCIEKQIPVSPKNPSVETHYCASIHKSQKNYKNNFIAGEVITYHHESRESFENKNDKNEVNFVETRATRASSLQEKERPQNNKAVKIDFSVETHPCPPSLRLPAMPCGNAWRAGLGVGRRDDASHHEGQINFDYGEANNEDVSVEARSNYTQAATDEDSYVKLVQMPLIIHDGLIGTQVDLSVFEKQQAEKLWEMFLQMCSVARGNNVFYEADTRMKKHDYRAIQEINGNKYFQSQSITKYMRLMAIFLICLVNMV